VERVERCGLVNVQKRIIAVEQHAGHVVAALAVGVIDHADCAVTAVGIVPDIAVDLIAVGPVALDRDKGKALRLDKPLGEPRPPGVILGGSMRRFAQEHIAGIPDPLEQGRQVVGGI
jgi:hypothetical protein